MTSFRRIEPCRVQWSSSVVHGWWHHCTNADAGHLGDHVCACGNRGSGVRNPTPDPGFEDPGIPERNGPSARQRFARWRVRRWDARVVETRAAYQASIEANGEGDYWWERELTVACGKQALWTHRAREWT